MAASLNKVILVGRLGQDPKLSYAHGGKRSGAGRPKGPYSCRTNVSFRPEHLEYLRANWPTLCKALDEIISKNMGEK